MHFLVGAIAPLIIFYLTTIPSQIDLSDSMRWWFVPFPSYCVTQSLVIEATLTYMILLKTSLKASGDFNGSIPDSDIFALGNMSSLMIALACIAVLCTLLIMILESDIFKCCNRASCFKLPAARTDIKFDDDVLKEH